MPPLAAVVTAVVGLAGVVLGVCTLLRAPQVERPPGGEGGLWPLVVALVAVAFALTVPSRPPFAVGLQLGGGFALGALLALLGAWLTDLQQGRRTAGQAGVFTLLAAHLGLVLVMVDVVLMTHYRAPLEMLGGLAIGVVFVLALAGSGGHCRRELDWLALAALALAGGEALAVQHFDPGALVARYYPLLAGSALLAGLLAAGMVVGRPPLRGDRSLSLLAGSATVLILPVLLCYLLCRACAGWHAPPPIAGLSSPGNLLAAVGTAVTAILLYALYVATRASLPEALRSRAVAGVGLLTVLLLVLSFKLLAGVGVALALLPLLAAAACALGFDTAADGSERPPGATTLSAGMLSVLQLGGLVLAYRLLLERTESLDLHPEQQYTLVGLLVGLAVPLLLTALSGPAGEALPAGQSPGLRRLAAPLAYTAALAALTPSLMLVVWDYKALLGLLLGFAAFVFFALYQAVTRAPEALTGRQRLGGLQCLLMALVAVQFSPLLQPLTELPRPQKAWVLAGALVLLAVLSLAPGLAAPRRGGSGDAA